MHREFAADGSPDALKPRGPRLEVKPQGAPLELKSRRARLEVKPRGAELKAAVRRLVTPIFGLLGIKPPPRSTTWALRGAAAVYRRLRIGSYDAVLATAPPMAALIAVRLGSRGKPFVAELRDLWAGNPTYDAGGRLLTSIERWIFAAADRIVVTTPEALQELEQRHPALAPRLAAIPNGFEPELLSIRRPDRTPSGRPLSIIHSGALTADRPLRPLLRVLGRERYRPSFRLVLHGYLAPEAAREVSEPSALDIEVVPPSSWRDAIQRMAAADVTLITQSRAAGDATAVAAKVYEYLALGKPVLCLTHGGATERLLLRLGAGHFCARLDDQASIAAALDRLMSEPLPPPVAPERLAPYDRRQIADLMSALLEGAGTASTNDVPRVPPIPLERR